MEETKDQSLIRVVLKNEITWIIAIITMVLGFVNTVILPIQKMQLQLTQIQTDIAQGKQDYQAIIVSESKLKSRLDIVETEIKPFINK